MNTVLQINVVCGTGSTGRIVTGIDKLIDKSKYHSYIAYGYGDSDLKNSIKIETKTGYYIHNFLSRCTGLQGNFSINSTKKFLKKVNKMSPNIIHLHNIHGNFINYKILFKYIKEKDIKVVWTLHDTWAITGKCTNYGNCDKWKNQCNKCDKLKEYPSSILDNTKREYINKKYIFNIVKPLIITPSNWLATALKQSYLKDCKIQVINNGIDLKKFKSVYSCEIRKKYNIENKFIILGVANTWGKNKGLDTFIKLSNILDEKYKIIVVGVNEKEEKKMPDNIIKIKRTNSIEELCKFYNEADVFLNPTVQDNFPTTNIEALACGTPVITYNTGGSPEIIDKNCGIIVEKGNFEKLIEAIEKLYKCNFKKEDCLKRASLYDEKKQLKKYEYVYDEILNKKF